MGFWFLYLCLPYRFYRTHSINKIWCVGGCFCTVREQRQESGILCSKVNQIVILIMTSFSFCPSLPVLIQATNKILFFCCGANKQDHSSCPKNQLSQKRKLRQIVASEIKNTDLLCMILSKDPKKLFPSLKKTKSQSSSNIIN